MGAEKVNERPKVAGGGAGLRAFAARTRSARAIRPAFTLIDLLVSLTVVAVLIGILLPSLSGVRESTRRVVCSSNVRQHGYGLALFAEDNRDALPPSTLIAQGQTDDTIIVRLAGDTPMWDGLGWLFRNGYMDNPAVFYCPSHTGDHPYSAYALAWNEEAGELIENYQYRGGGGEWLSHLGVRTPSYALIADGLRTRDDFNHKIGSNVLRADLSMLWYLDRTGLLSAGLPDSVQDTSSALRVNAAWRMLDTGPH